ncbi:MAG: site-specific integrase [Planctomycetota bacterium]|nr:site-specific integrase [Planctomycetota bacterium]
MIDIHALRHTFGTHLSAAGVHPRTAMAAMRHSRMELTMTYYTDPVLLDVAGAVETLPDFSGKTAGTVGRGQKTAVGAAGRA